MHFEIIINEPREKVWDTMLNKKTYAIWTAPFNAGGSTYEGNWEQGEEIRFLGPDPETGEIGGMFSRIKESRKPEFTSIEHIGIIKPDGSVDTTSDEVKKWAPAYENYTLTEVGNSTHVRIDQDIDPAYRAMFEEMWPKALQKLKELAEQS